MQVTVQDLGIGLMATIENLIIALAMAQPCVFLLVLGSWIVVSVPEQELGRPAGRRHQRTTQELQATGRSAFAREVLAQCCNCGPRGLALELGTLLLGQFHFSLHLVD